MPLTPGGNSAWGNRELLYLIEAWDEVIDDPKDRLMLSTGERATLHARFCVIASSNRRSLSSVTRQHHRVCTAYRLIVATNKKSLKRGTPSWFELSTAEQHELRRAYTKKEKGLLILSPELFRKIDRMCGNNGGGKYHKGKELSKKVVKRSPHAKNPEPEDEAEFVDTPKAAWTPQDWAMFVDAWQEAVDEFIDYGNEPDEKVKLPNWLIRQKFVALGGSQDTTVGSITAKKRCIIHSYNFICQCVNGLEALDGSDWFDYTFTERFRLQRKLVNPKSSQRVGCEIDRETYQTIGSVLEKEEILETITVTGRKRKRGRRKIRKSSMSSDPSSDQSVIQSPTSSLSEDADDMSEAEDPPTKHPSPIVNDDERSQVDEQVVEALLEAQNARFEQLLRDLREERMEERKQNQAMLLAILHERKPTDDLTENATYMEALVGKQQEQLVSLFAQMHKERQQEREDFHALLRQLCSRS
ncbi:uncharacterized protein PHALS_08094 [Plasmopara halstedii]|uniref:Uncharacterized protein n=1 Tax=Plasmopara halstedii TaxID=4781 RepID=A0A0P1B7J2_PLAHL|nr:uncharacterized protein PHALS_08094 [Plasmopara halstedii]CEG50382.1 hypothetical protein PHALS_08094 [Plasmopara halstedii]|eukprot:XP_024586751.1 hypothetical protein PHALS_08094 [Plasmopara halstedii]